MSDEGPSRGIPSPGRLDLDSLKKEAKRWRRALREGDAEARARLEQANPGAPARPTLRDVQHALAREHGFAGWTALKDAVERAQAIGRESGARALAQYEEMADALLDAYRTGTPEAMERHYRHTWHRRAWHAMRTYVQLDLGKRPAHPGGQVEITRHDARHLVALEHGFADWADLQAFTAAGKAGPRIAAKPLRIVRCDGDDPDEWPTIARSRDWDEIVRLLSQHRAVGLGAAGQMTDPALAEISRGETITGLGLSGCRAITDEGVRHLATLPSLQHLDLSGTGITDAGLSVLRHLPRLRTLSLAGTRVTDEGAASLAHCGDLERVNLAATGAGDGALRALAGKRKLRHLAISLTEAGLPLLHELPAFKSWQGDEAKMVLLGPRRLPTHLWLRGSFGDRGLRHLRGLDGLFSLDIDDRRLGIPAAGLEPLIDLPHLGALALNAEDEEMPYVARMPHLRYLGVQDTVAGDEGFEALSRSQSIEYIWGRRCHNLRRRGFVALARMPALRGLAVSCLNVDEAGVAVLPRFPALRELMPMDVPDDGYRHVGRCQALESLILMYCRDTTDAATAHIAGLPRLSSYFNSYTAITDRTPELLSRMDSLEQITFDTCHWLTNAGVVTLARLPNLRELRVSGRGITSEVRRGFPPAVRVVCEP
jgi:hypothetical protein